MTAFVELDAKKANSVVGMLEEHYKDVHYYLNFSTPIELLVAAILSAQTKDTKVNAITPRLFGKYKTAKDYADAKPAELMGYVGGVLYAKNKVYPFQLFRILCPSRLSFCQNYPLTINKYHLKTI